MEHTHTHRLEGGVMMGKDYMLAIIIVNYDGRTHTHTHIHNLCITGRPEFSHRSVRTRSRTCR